MHENSRLIPHAPGSGAVLALRNRPTRVRSFRVRVRGQLRVRRPVDGRVIATLSALAACAALLQFAVRADPASVAGAQSQQLPLVIETAAAAVVAVAAAEPVHAARLLPVRAVALTLIAVLILSVGCIGTDLYGGTAAILRDLAGSVGVGLLAAASAGANLAWVGPLAFFMPAEPALTHGWTTPWLWPARPPHDTGAALCAALVFAAGVVAISAGRRADGR